MKKSHDQIIKESHETKSTRQKSQNMSSSNEQLRHARPITPGQRHKVSRIHVLDGIQWVPKSFQMGSKHTGGRNHTGRITTRHRGGGIKTVLRQVKPLSPGHDVTILGIQWDPQRSAPIALIHDNSTSQRAYVMAGEGMKVGDRLVGPLPSTESNSSSTGSPLPTSSRTSDILPNTRCQRGWRREGTTFYDLSLDGASMMKAAGTYATVLSQRPAERDAEGQPLSRAQTRVRLPSGEERRCFSTSYATVGRVAGENHRLEVYGKAGTRRRMGIRPTVRGCAMNPIDHPHGGRTKGGRHDVTPWAKISKGQPTRPDHLRSVFVVKTVRQAKSMKLA